MRKQPSHVDGRNTMKQPHPAPDACDERARLAALEAADILDTPPEQAFDDLVLLAAQVCRAPVSLVSFIAADRQWFKARRGTEACGSDRAVSFCTHAVADGRPLVVNDAQADPRFRDNPLVAGEPHIRFYAGQPIRDDEGHTLGTVCVLDTVPRALDADQAAALAALGRQAEALLRLRRQGAAAARHNAELAGQVHAARAAQALACRLATRDALTDLPNRRPFLERLRELLAAPAEHEPAAGRDGGRWCGLLFVDLDHFKHVNDTLGHAAGDAVLRAAADRLREGLREGDALGRPADDADQADAQAGGEGERLVARMGGDEFCVLLGELGRPEDARRVAERLARRLAEPVPLPDGGSATCPASLGVASFEAGCGASPDAVLARADRALYAAKGNGRNAVHVAEDAPYSPRSPHAPLPLSA